MKIQKNVIFYFLPYTLFFLLFSFIFIMKVVYDDKILLWNPDGIGQHFVSFVYLCNFLHKLIHFDSISFFDFHIGQGADILTTLNSYDFTDPICWITSLIYPISIKSRYILMIFIKLYLIGISFIIYCISIEFKSNFHNTLGALAYTFSGAIIFYFARHPNFIHFAYYTPLLFAGVEFFIRNKKYIFLPAILFFNILASFYCAYIDCLLLGIYILVLNFYRIFVCKKSSFSNEIIIDIKICSICLCSILLSSFILFPTIYSYIINGRLNSITGYTDSFIFYPSQHYVEYVFNLFIPDISQSSTHIGMNIFCLFSIIYCLLNNRNLYLLYFVIFVVMSCIPFCGLAFNGFGYVSNRWVFIIPFFASVLLVVTMNNIDNISKNLWNLIHLLIALFLFSHVILPEGDYNIQSLFMCAIFVIGFFLYRFKKIIMPCFVVFVGVFFSLYLTFLTPSKKYLSQFPDNPMLNHFFYDSSSMAHEIDSSFFRVEKFESDQIFCNTSVFNNVYGVASRWSIVPYYIKDYYTHLGFATTMGNCIFLGLDSRTIPSTLAGVKYFTCPTDAKAYAPYGFYDLKTNDRYTVLKNKFYLPLAYFYDATFPETLLPYNNPLLIENIMLNCAIVEDRYNLLDKKYHQEKDNEIDYFFDNFYNIIYKNNELNMLDKNNFFELRFSSIKNINSEVFVVINGLELSGAKNQVTMYIECDSSIDQDRNVIKKTAKISNREYLWHTDVNNLVFNLGSRAKDISKIKIYFDEKCKIKYKDLKIIVRDNKIYEDAIAKIKQDLPFDIVLKEDLILLKVNSELDKILQLSIPYSAGWEGYIDNCKVDIFRSNIMYTAMFVNKGHHEIKLIYHTPYLRCGIKISLITFLCVLLFACYKLRKTHLKRQ